MPEPRQARRTRPASGLRDRALLVLLAILVLPRTAPPAAAGPFDGRPKILLHVVSPTTKDPCTSGRPADCGEAVTSGAAAGAGAGGPALHFVYLLAARGDLDHIGAVKCGIEYGRGSELQVLGWSLCAAAQAHGDAHGAATAWPEPGSDLLVTWDTRLCPDSESRAAGYFYMAAYGADTLLVTASHAEERGRTATIRSCTGHEVVLESTDLGHAVFSAGAAVPGCNPCLTFCRSETPAIVTTWGRIKAVATRDSP